MPTTIKRVKSGSEAMSIDSSRALSSKNETVDQGDNLKRSRSASTTAINMIMGAVFVGLMLFSANSTLIGAYDATRLQRSGVATSADVTRLFKSSCGKGKCIISADYTFVARDPETEQPKSYGGTARVGSDDELSDSSLLEVQASSVLPIVYDKTAPNFSRENLKGRIFAPHPWQSALRAFSIMAGMLTVIVGGIWAIILVTTWKSKAL